MARTEVSEDCTLQRVSCRILLYGNTKQGRSVNRDHIPDPSLRDFFLGIKVKGIGLFGNIRSEQSPHDHKRSPKIVTYFATRQSGAVSVACRVSGRPRCDGGIFHSNPPSTKKIRSWDA